MRWQNIFQDSSILCMLLFHLAALIQCLVCPNEFTDQSLSIFRLLSYAVKVHWIYASNCHISVFLQHYKTLMLIV